MHGRDAEVKEKKEAWREEARAVLDEEVIDGVYAAAKGVFNRKHCPVHQELGEGLECVLKLLAGHRMGVGERRQHRALRVGSWIALVRHRKLPLAESLLHSSDASSSSAAGLSCRQIIL